jgi:hypothetical protein
MPPTASSTGLDPAQHEPELLEADDPIWDEIDLESDSESESNLATSAFTLNPALSDSQLPDSNLTGWEAAAADQLKIDPFVLVALGLLAPSQRAQREQLLYSTLDKLEASHTPPENIFQAISRAFLTSPHIELGLAELAHVHAAASAKAARLSKRGIAVQPTTANPFANSDLFAPHNKIYLPFVQAAKSDPVETPVSRWIGTRVALTCPLFNGPLLNDRHLNDQGQEDWVENCPTGKEAHALMDVLVNIFPGEPVHGTDVSSTDCLGALNRLEYFLARGIQPQARVGPSSRALQFFRALHTCRFKQFYS